GAQVPIAAAGYYATPAAIATPSARFVCATALAVTDRGPGPMGEVFSFDTTHSFPIRCWGNARGGSTLWSSVVVADAALGEPPDAFWLKAAMPYPNDSSSILVAGWRDAEFDRSISVAVNRAAREISFTKKVTLHADGSISASPALSADGGTTD